MKITKTRLKEIIKEEVEKATLNVNEVDLSQVFQQRQAQKAAKATGKEPAPDANPNATKIQDVARMLQYIDKIDTPQEYSNLLDKVIGHAQNVKGSVIILRKLQKALPSLMKEDLQEKKNDDWIQDAEKDIEKRGTEGVCTGDKFGGPTCKPGTKRYNLAKTFRKMAKNKKKEADLDETSVMGGAPVGAVAGHSGATKKVTEQ